MAVERLILASASPQRAELLASLGVDFEVQVCGVSEPRDRPEKVRPRQWAEALAYFKARWVGEQHRGRWVLGADTIVVCSGQVLGKPGDAEEARRMLELQAGQVSEVITGVALVRVGRSAYRLLRSAVTRVWMRAEPSEIEAYLATGAWRGKAGAYGVQESGERLIGRMEGSRSNVIGLPLECVEWMLSQVGAGSASAGDIWSKRQ